MKLINRLAEMAYAMYWCRIGGKERTRLEFRFTDGYLEGYREGRSRAAFRAKALMSQELNTSRCFGLDVDCDWVVGEISHIGEKEEE